MPWPYGRRPRSNQRLRRRWPGRHHHRRRPRRRPAGEDLRRGQPGTASHFPGLRQQFHRRRVRRGQRPRLRPWAHPAASHDRPVDLAGQRLSVVDLPIRAKKFVALSSIRNNGPAASPSFSVQWVLSRDAFGSADDIPLIRPGSGISDTCINRSPATELASPSR